MIGVNNKISNPNNSLDQKKFDFDNDQINLNEHFRVYFLISFINWSIVLITTPEEMIDCLISRLFDIMSFKMELTKYLFLFDGSLLDITGTSAKAGLYQNSKILVTYQFNNEINNKIEYKNYFDVIFKVKFHSIEKELIIKAKPEEKVGDLINRFKLTTGSLTRDIRVYIFIFDGIILENYMILAQVGLFNNASIFVIERQTFKENGPWFDKEINIKFIKNSKNATNIVSCCQLNSILNLCLLKEIVSKLSFEKIKLIKPDILSYIMRILKNGCIETDKYIKETNKKLLKKIEGSNIVNFSEYVDELINKNHIDILMNYLDKGELNKINDIKYRLSNYNKYINFFIEEFEKSKKESVFEFSIVSLVIMERQDFQRFEKERNECPNRVDKILYHGTSIEPISCKLTSLFKKFVDRHYQHGKGVYFTDFLDYCWFYGGEENNRININRIPQVNETFTLIVNYIYYNKNGFNKVTDSNYTPKKNEINFAYVGAHFETLINPNWNKFVGTEYVIRDLEQICPFMSAKLKRNEYCVIWRNNNFSPNQVFNNKLEEIFESFLRERIKYIKQIAKYNIYPCETSEEALKLIERKKYNKIILITNVGTNLEGKTFITNARKIIGNNVIILFLSYDVKHFNWIKDYKNGLFSNDPTFYEEYLDSFEDEYINKIRIKTLIDKIERNYNFKFNFDEYFLDYPNFKESGKYNDLSFNNY